MREVDAENPFGDGPARRAENVMDLLAAGSCKSSHIQRALSKADNCHALIVEDVQRLDLAFCNDRPRKLLLAGKWRLIFSLGILSAGDDGIFEDFLLHAFLILIAHEPAITLFFQRQNFMLHT